MSDVSTSGRKILLVKRAGPEQAVLELDFFRTEVNDVGKPPVFLGNNQAVEVHDLSAAREWYKAKLGMCDAKTHREDDSGRSFADLCFSNDETILSLIESESGRNAENRAVIFFAKNLEKTQQWLAGRALALNPTDDSGGNRFFRFQDLEGNTIEVCVEPDSD